MRDLQREGDEEKDDGGRVLINDRDRIHYPGKEKNITILIVKMIIIWDIYTDSSYINIL